MKTIQEKSKLFIVLLFIVISFTVGCEPQEKYERTVELSKPAGGCEVVEAQTKNGDIVYSGNETSDCRVIAKIQARARVMETAQRLAEETKVSLEEADNKIIVKIEKPDGENKSISVSLDIVGPKQMAVVFVSCNGDISARQVSKSVSATTTNGDIEASDIGANAYLMSCNGDIKVNRINKSITAKTSNGDITISDANGDSDLVSSNGDIDLFYSAESADVSNIVMCTSNGDIDLKAPRWDSATVEISTGNGKINSQFLLNFKGEIKGTGKWVIGDGSTKNKLKVSTSNGDIKIY